MSKRTRREESRLRINGEIADHISVIDDRPGRKELAPISADLTPRGEDNPLYQQQLGGRTISVGNDLPIFGRLACTSDRICTSDTP
jgi:hypothetical protein